MARRNDCAVQAVKDWTVYSQGYEAGRNNEAFPCDCEEPPSPEWVWGYDEGLKVYERNNGGKDER